MTTPTSWVPAVIWPSNRPHMVLASVTAPTNDVMTCLLRVLPTTGRRTHLFRLDRRLGVDLGGGEAGQGLGRVDIDEDAVILDLDLGDELGMGGDEVASADIA